MDQVQKGQGIFNVSLTSCSLFENPVVKPIIECPAPADCPAPPEGCHYNPTYDMNNCFLTCGPLTCGPEYYQNLRPR